MYTFYTILFQDGSQGIETFQEGYKNIFILAIMQQTRAVRILCGKNDYEVINFIVFLFI